MKILHGFGGDDAVFLTQGMPVALRSKIALTITPTSGWVQSATYTDLAGTATHTGSATITAVEVDVNGGGYSPVDSFVDGAWSVTSLSLDEGANTITVRATDSDAKTKTASITISVDTVDPVVSLGSDVTHDGTGDVFTLTSSMFTETNPATVEYRLDSGDWASWASPYADTDITIAATTDSHTIDLRVTDLSGRQVSDQVAVNYSLLSVTITPTTGQWEQSATYTEFAGTASNPGATVTDVEWKLGSGGTYAAVDSFSGGNWSVTSITLSEGENTLYVRATDSNLDILESSITVNVDTINPVVNLGADTTHDGTGDTFTLDYSAMVTEANPSLVEYQLDSGGYTTWTNPYEDVVLNIPADTSNHTIDLRVTDLSGRQASDQAGVNYQSSVSYLLDKYPSAAVAYSVRLLDADYTGPLVKIRRDSDQAEKDFYPDLSDELSMSSEDGSSTSLSSWIGSASGYITTWYDQSGNSRNANQTTAANQPMVVNAGVLVTKNSRAGIDFAGHMLDVTLTVNQPLTQLAIATKRATAPDSSTIATGLTNRAHIYYLNGFRLYAGIVLTSSYTSNDQNIHIAIFNGATSLLRCNGAIKASGNASTSGLGTTLRIGGQGDMAYYWDGSIQEFVIWPSDQSINTSGIESDANSFYGAYVL